MTKKKKVIDEVLLPRQIVEEQTEVVEKPVMEEPVTVDPKIGILQEFAELWKAECKGHSIVKIDVARKIWDICNKLNGRTDRFNGCASCLPPKVAYLKKLCLENNIEL